MSAPQYVQPQPTPFQAEVGVGTTPDGRQVVSLTLHLVTGRTVVFLPPDGATTLATDLTRAGKQAATGLILPNPRSHVVSKP